ncbi:unnamed protein product [Rotaria sordida]|uniref:Uncharacterized protein n=1 Tax=Rotaria sordida TaxID=392033 RepID=A0A815PK20_9BILA|nr:unnamed protein product [Rotaria sordida]CAF1450317.1 unnamed protein product [Rotaria sordida]
MVTSIVSNGSLISEKWFKIYSKYLDIFAISCDSFDDEYNRQAGRTNGYENHSQILHVRRVRHLCQQYGIIFKINSVIHALNYHEDMTYAIEEFEPIRLKVLECLLINEENAEFCQHHQHLKCFVSESNIAMRNSYLILDEHMRFLDCRNGRKDLSPSILDVGVEAALNRSGFDEEVFFKRDGQYKWTKDIIDLNDW